LNEIVDEKEFEAAIGLLNEFLAAKELGKSITELRE
jgi:hypothetical protein